MKPKKRSKPLPLSLVVETALALRSRPEHKDTPLNDLLGPAVEFILAAEDTITAERKSEK